MVGQCREQNSRFEIHGILKGQNRKIEKNPMKNKRLKD